MCAPFRALTQSASWLRSTKLVELGVNGLALSPAEDARVRARVMELSSKVPVVTFNTDLPESGRLCYVGPDNYAFGRASAGLMNLLLAGKGSVLVVGGQENNLAHRQRVRRLPR